MNNDILIGVALLMIAGGLIFIGLPNKAGVSPRFLRFDASVVLYPPLILVFVAGGFAELIVGFLRSN
jgi:hypothetical protein